MLLYHGTTAEKAEDAKTVGIRPRYSTESKWREKPSNPECVYLTTIYGPMYAMYHLRDSRPAEAQALAVVEIKTDALIEASFLPGEDAVGQAEFILKVDGEPLIRRIDTEYQQNKQEGGT